LVTTGKEEVAGCDSCCANIKTGANSSTNVENKDDFFIAFLLLGECKSWDDEYTLKVLLFLLGGFLGGFQGKCIKNEVIQRGLIMEPVFILNGKTLLIKGAGPEKKVFTVK
jgi:hypothetical protein